MNPNLPRCPFCPARTSVKLSYIGHSAQSSLETFHYLDCSSNSTAPARGTP